MQSNDELKRRLAAVDCQLRKEQKAVRRYEVATEKLLQFVEVTILCIITAHCSESLETFFTQNCHEALIKTPEADRIL